VPRDQHDPPVDGAAVLTQDNPLTRYRAAQARLRRQFAPFTRAVCPGCPTPCCRRPAAVTPFDVALAEELGYPLPAGAEAANDAIAVRLGLIPVPTLSSDGPPCAFLGPSGCSFPPDLMPFGCVAFLCSYMEDWYTPDQMAALRAAIADLDHAHRELRDVLLCDKQ
jgi:hypothetical protein